MAIYVRSLILGLLVFLSLLTLVISRPLTDEDLGTVVGPFEPNEPLEPPPPPPPPPTTRLTYDSPPPFPQTESIYHKSSHEAEPQCPFSNTFCRASFPPNFIFGTSTSAFQIEGAKNGLGRGLSTWDDFTHKYADKVDNRGDADIATDSYNRYEEDIKMMKELNTNGYRFSISWTRILPHGRVEKGVNEEGINYYHKLIDKLKENDIEPVVTLFHWETPLSLEEDYDGFLNKRIVDDFRAFAKICFERFGSKVKNWATFNEPWVYSVGGYSRGKKAPGRCSKWVHETCIVGDSGTEPYIVSHNQILAHIAAVEEFRNCKQCQENGGKIGIVFNCPWFEPYDPNSESDRKAAEESLEFNLGWFLHPLTYGYYPGKMNDSVGDRLPSFSAQESQKLVTSMDFVGLNYYGAFFSTYRTDVNASQLSYANDHRIDWKSKQIGSPSLKASSMGIVMYAKGLRGILNYIKNNYKNPEIYIMENGLDEYDNGGKPIKKALADRARRNFLRDHLWNLEKAVCQDKVRVKGYFFWSLMDNFEWNLGYSTRFGLYYVDYKNDLKRYMRSSGKWYRDFLKPDTAKRPSRPVFRSTVIPDTVADAQNVLKGTLGHTPRDAIGIPDNIVLPEEEEEEEEEEEIKNPNNYVRYVSDMM